MRSSVAPGLVLALVAAAAIGLANCSASGGNATSVPTPKPSPSPTLPGANLYVGNFTTTNFVQYKPAFSAASTPALTVGSEGYVGVASDTEYVAATFSGGSDLIDVEEQPLTTFSTPVATIPTASTCELAAFDGLGDLWVALDNSTVVEFVPPFSNATVPTLTVSTGVSAPVGIAFDAANNLYVVNSTTSPPQLLVFASPYAAAPTVLNLPLTSPAEAIGVAVFQNELAVSVFDQTVGARTHGSPRPLAWHRRSTWAEQMRHGGGVKPPGVAAGGEILVYGLPITASSTATTTIPLTEPEDVAFDATGDLYVTDEALPASGGGVLAFTTPITASSTPAFSITTGIDNPSGLDFGP